MLASMFMRANTTANSSKIKEKPPDENYCEVTFDHKNEMFKHNVPHKKDNSFMGTMNEKRNFVIWLVISIILAMFLARYSKGLCVYLFISFSWLFIWTIATQSWTCGEKAKEDIALALFATVLGWVVGTFIVWRSVPFHRGFFQGW